MAKGSGSTRGGASGHAGSSDNSLRNAAGNVGQKSAVTMDKATYNEMGKTAQGRKEAHDIMVQAVRDKMDALISAAPEANRGKLKQLFDKAHDAISKFGNKALFEDFADKDLPLKSFISNVDAAAKGNYYDSSSMLYNKKK